MSVAQDCLERVENDPILLDHVITGDKNWFFQYDSLRQQWLSPDSAKPKQARMNKSKVKMMMICSFNGKRVMHKELAPPG